MSGLIIIIADAAPERFRTALILAATQAALGGTVRMFFQGAAVGLLRAPIADPDTEAQQRAGLPTLAQLVEEALGLGVAIGACQSSLGLLGTEAGAFDSRIIWGGMIGVLSSLDRDDRLVVV